MKSALLIFTLLIASSLAFYESNSKVVTLTKDNFQKLVIESKDIWLVEFYANWCGHCKNLAPEYEKAAKALEGIIKLGAVNMETDQSVGGPYGVQGFPTLKFFGENKSSPVDYSGERKATGIVSYLIEQAKTISNKRLGLGGSSGSSSSGSKAGSSSESQGTGDEKDIIILDDSNFNDIVLKSNDAWFIKFYAPWCGHCKKLAPTWAKLATELKGEVKVAKVDATVATELGKRFGVSGYPTIKFFPAGPKDDGSAVDYNGGRELNPLKEYALEQKSKNKPIMFKQLTQKADFEEYCSNFQGVCILTFVPHIYDSSASERNSYIKIAEDIAVAQRGKPFSFLWSEGGVQYELEEKFAVGGSGYPCVLALSAKKSVYTVLKGAFSQKNFEDFMKKLIAGKESFMNYSGLPQVKKAVEWDGQDKKRPDAAPEDL